MRAAAMQCGPRARGPAVEVLPDAPMAGMRPPRARAGQSMVELALCLPLLLVILFAVTDFGRVVATDTVAQNAAKQAAVVAARHYSAPVACLQSQARQVVAAEVANGQAVTVTLTDVTPATPSYTGEHDVRATVDVPLTFIAPFLQPWGNAAHPLLIHATDAEHVIAGATTGVAPLIAGATVAVTRTATDDQITWTMPSGWAPATIPDTSTTPPTTDATTFHLFEAITDVSPPPAAGCPVPGAVQLVATTPAYVYTIDHDLDPAQDQSTPANRLYWIVANAPVNPSSGQTGAASAPLSVP